MFLFCTTFDVLKTAFRHKNIFMHKIYAIFIADRALLYYESLISLALTLERLEFFHSSFAQNINLSL